MRKYQPESFLKILALLRFLSVYVWNDQPFQVMHSLQALCENKIWRLLLEDQDFLKQGRSFDALVGCICFIPNNSCSWFMALDEVILILCRICWRYMFCIACEFQLARSEVLVVSETSDVSVKYIYNNNNTRYLFCFCVIC